MHQKGFAKIIFKIDFCEHVTNAFLLTPIVETSNKCFNVDKHLNFIATAV